MAYTRTMKIAGNLFISDMVVKRSCIMHEPHVLSMTLEVTPPSMPGKNAIILQNLSFLVHAESWKAECVRTLIQLRKREIKK